jgi:hypothetical protein
VTGQIPTISFHCSCGERLYTIGTNALSYDAYLQCKCGEEYECRNSLIAVAVQKTQEIRSPSHIPSQPVSGKGV